MATTLNTLSHKALSVLWTRLCENAETARAAGPYDAAPELAPWYEEQARTVEAELKRRETTRDHGYPIIHRATVRGVELIIADRTRDYPDLHPFVVWTMDTAGQCEHGSYCSTLAEAVVAFVARQRMCADSREIARVAGRLAFQLGAPVESNPYPVESAGFIGWACCWGLAQQDVQDAKETAQA